MSGGSGWNKTHGLSKTPAYQSWKAMVRRCMEPRAANYNLYGGRGITVCERWMTFENFLADMGERPDGQSIGRIDGNGNYCPENCRWETDAQQALNRSSNRYFEINGEVHCVSEWARRMGLAPDLVCTRVKRGWTIERALTAVRQSKDKSA